MLGSRLYIRRHLYPNPHVSCVSILALFFRTTSERIISCWQRTTGTACEETPALLPFSVRLKGALHYATRHPSPTTRPKGSGSTPSARKRGFPRRTDPRSPRHGAQDGADR